MSVSLISRNRFLLSQNYIGIIRAVSNKTYTGKPDKQSNIRPLFIEQNDNDTPLQKRLKTLQVETQNWHHHFWAEHNEKYSKGREVFIQKWLTEKGYLPDEQGKLEPEDMAVFHRQFLKDNMVKHRIYDKEWKSLNRRLLSLMLQVTVQKCFYKFLPFLNRKQ